MNVTDATVYTETVVEADIGSCHVDTTQKYGNGIGLGRAVEAVNIYFEDVLISIKVEGGNMAYDDVITAAVDRVDQPGFDRIGLLNVHWPAVADISEKMLASFDRVNDEGRARHVGVCNFFSEQLDETDE